MCMIVSFCAMLTLRSCVSLQCVMCNVYHSELKYEWLFLYVMNRMLFSCFQYAAFSCSLQHGMMWLHVKWSPLLNISITLKSTSGHWSGYLSSVHVFVHIYVCCKNISCLSIRIILIVIIALVSLYSILVETKVHLVLLTIDQHWPPMSLVPLFFLLIFSVGVYINLH